MVGTTGNVEPPDSSSASISMPRFAAASISIEGENQGNAELHQLDGQVKVSLKVGGVHDVDDGRGSFLNQEIPGHEFFGGVGGEGIGSREIHQPYTSAAEVAETFLLFHGDAGIVSHMLPRAGDGIEEGGFSAVGISSQGDQQWLGGVIHGCPPPRPG